MRLRATLASLFVALLLIGGSAPAQTSSTRATLQTQNNNTIAPNGVGAITGAVMNAMIGNVIASEATLLDFNNFSNAPVYAQSGILFSSAGNPLLFQQCNGVIQANGASPPTCLGSSAFPLVPNSTSISPSTNGGLLSDNNGILKDSTSLPSGISLSGAVGLPLSTGVSGQLPLANGGSSANLTPSNGGVVYSGASSLAILAGTATANQCLLSGSNAAPTWGACPSAIGVTSFNSRVGAVIPSGGDYTTGQLTTGSSGSSPTTGQIGETITNLGSSGVSIGNGTVVTLATVSLSAGDWNCIANSQTSLSSVTGWTTDNQGITATPVSFPAYPAGVTDTFGSTTNSVTNEPYSAYPTIFHLTTTTNISVVRQMAHSGGTITAQGYIQCVRQD